MTCRCSDYNTVIAADSPLIYIVCDGAVPTGTTLEAATRLYDPTAYTVTVGALTPPSGNGSVRTGPTITQAFTGFGDHLEAAPAGGLPRAGVDAWSMEVWINSEGQNPYVEDPRVVDVLTFSLTNDTDYGHEVRSIHLETSGLLAGALYAYDSLGYIVFTPPGVVTTNTWQHIVLTWNPVTGAALFYVDCRVVGAFTNSSGTPDATLSADRLLIGCRDRVGQEAFSGCLADMAVYPYALSPCQVMCHYEAATGQRCCARPAHAQAQIVD